MKILFVCHGNICRSPMAEFVMRDLVEKAGLGDDKIRMLMDYTGVSREVADPWYTGNFDQTFTDVLSGCKALLGQLMQEM